jgi:Zn-dependent peptidase ImmA (M78 family)
MYLTDEKLEEIVRKFLRGVGLELQIRPDMMTIIVKTKTAFPGFNYRRIPDSQMPDEEAQWNSDTLTVAMRESVFTAMQRSEPRARMTLAHELSHFLLGHEGLRNRSIAPKAYERRVRTVRNEETEAKRCASIMLAPEHLVSDDPNLDELVTKFGLSDQAALIRLESILRLRRRARGELRDLPPKVSDFLREARRRGKELRTPLDDDTDVGRD